MSVPFVVRRKINFSVSCTRKQNTCPKYSSISVVKMDQVGVIMWNLTKTCPSWIDFQGAILTRRNPLRAQIKLYWNQRSRLWDLAYELLPGHVWTVRGIVDCHTQPCSSVTFDTKITKDVGINRPKMVSIWHEGTPFIWTTTRVETSKGDDQSPPVWYDYQLIMKAWLEVSNARSVSAPQKNIASLLLHRNSTFNVTRQAHSQPATKVYFDYPKATGFKNLTRDKNCCSQINLTNK